MPECVQVSKLNGLQKTCVHILLNRYSSHYFKNFSPVDFNMKGQETLIIEVGKFFTPLNKLEGCVDWLQEQSQPIMESEGHNRKRLCCSCGFCHYLQWKKTLYAMGTAIYHSLFASVAKIINMKNTFQKGRHVFAYVKHISFQVTVVKMEHQEIFFPPLKGKEIF